MTTIYRLPVWIAFPVTLCATTVLVNAQRHSKTIPRQKDIVEKESAIDSTLRRKIDSQLLQAITQRLESKTTGAEAQFPIDIGADSNGNLPVDISATITDSLLHIITSLGGKIIYPSKEYHTVRAVINLYVVKAIASRPDVSFIQPAGQAHNNTVAPSRKLN